MKTLVATILVLAVWNCGASRTVPGYYNVKSRNDYSIEPRLPENMVVAIDTDARQPTTTTDAIDNLQQAIAAYFQKPENNLFRARDQYNIKPERITFDSETGRPRNALKVDLTANSIMQAVNELMSSPKVKLYADMFARKAAVLYRTVKDEMTKEERGESRYRD